MFKTLLATTALCLVSAAGLAADLPRRAAAVAPAPVFVSSNWGGLYVGVVGGYAWGKSNSAPTGAIAGEAGQELDLKGALVGAQAGYDFDMGNGLVLGGVADLSWSGAKGKSCVETNNGPGCTSDPDDSYARGSVKWLSTLRAKAGFAITKDILLYGTAGLAAGGGRSSVSFLTSSSDPLVSDKRTHYGWTVGAGAEYRLTQSISVGAEYLYADLGKKGYDYTNAGVTDLASAGAYGVRADAKLHIVRASLNYRFGGSAPVVARY
ncbi:MAG: omp31 [Hyphomicrobiales bacterium]|nr:omp31 [Hyphomicrobiales bacterium]